MDRPRAVKTEGMPSNREDFWKSPSFALVANSARKPFPELSYAELRKRGKKVFAVDPSRSRVLGDPAYPDLAALPEKVDAVVIETPRDETGRWVDEAGRLGIKDAWIHMLRETPEALAIGRSYGMNVRTGSCAMIYLGDGASYHAVHRGLDKWLGRY